VAALPDSVDLLEQIDGFVELAAHADVDGEHEPICVAARTAEFERADIAQVFLIVGIGDRLAFLVELGGQRGAEGLEFGIGSGVGDFCFRPGDELMLKGGEERADLFVIGLRIVGAERDKLSLRGSDRVEIPPSRARLRFIEPRPPGRGLPLVA
jgi:hypothetical protein